MYADFALTNSEAGHCRFIAGESGLHKTVLATLAPVLVSACVSLPPPSAPPRDWPQLAQTADHCAQIAGAYQNADVSLKGKVELEQFFFITSPAGASATKIVISQRESPSLAPSRVTLSVERYFGSEIGSITEVELLCQGAWLVRGEPKEPGRLAVGPGVLAAGTIKATQFGKAVDGSLIVGRIYGTYSVLTIYVIPIEAESTSGTSWLRFLPI